MNCGMSALRMGHRHISTTTLATLGGVKQQRTSLISSGTQKRRVCRFLPCEQGGISPRYYSGLVVPDVMLMLKAGNGQGHGQRFVNHKSFFTFHLSPS